MELCVVTDNVRPWQKCFPTVFWRNIVMSPSWNPQLGYLTKGIVQHWHGQMTLCSSTNHEVINSLSVLCILSKTSSKGTTKVQWHLEKRHNHEKKGQETEETADGHCQELTQNVPQWTPRWQDGYFTFLCLWPFWVVTPQDSRQTDMQMSDTSKYTVQSKQAIWTKCTIRKGSWGRSKSYLLLRLKCSLHVPWMWCLQRQKARVRSVRPNERVMVAWMANGGLRKEEQEHWRNGKYPWMLGLQVRLKGWLRNLKTPCPRN